MTRIDGRKDYRRAKKVKIDEEATTVRDPHGQPQFHDHLHWPINAFHQEDHFGEIFDAGQDMLRTFSRLLSSQNGC